MTKQIVALVAIILFLFGTLFLVYLLTSRSPASTPSTVKLPPKAFIYFHGLTCPNCQELNEWIKQNKIDQKVKYQKLEVYYNKDNAALLEQAAAVCNLPANQIGVPFVYVRGKCYIGLPQAKKILQEKAHQ